MNGYGHFLRARALVPALLGRGRGAAAGGGASCSGCAGTDTAWRTRLAHRAGALDAAGRWPRPSPRRSCSSRTGAWIFYNTNVLNPYRTEFARGRAPRAIREAVQALAAKPQPKITGGDASPWTSSRTSTASAIARDVHASKNNGEAGDPEICTSTSRDGQGPQARRASRADGSSPSSRPSSAGTLTRSSAARARRHDDARLRPRVRAARLHERRARSRMRGGQRHVPRTASRPAASSATRAARSSSEDRDRAASTGSSPSERMPDLDDAAAASSNYIIARRRLDRLRGHGEHLADQIAHGARLPAARVDRGRPALFPLQDGRADPQLLRVPLGALRGEARRMARLAKDVAHRDLLPARPRVRPRPHGRRA